MAEEQDAPAWAQRLSAFIHRRYRVVLLVGLVFAVLSTLAATQLRIDQELRRLLPSTFPSVVRLDRLQERAGQQSDLYVTIRSPSREANVAFGDAVASALEGREELRYVVFRRDLKYFDDHALLYASLADLLDLRRRVIAKIRAEVRKEAFGDFSTDEEKAEKAGGKDDAEALGFDPDEMRERYGVSEASQEYMEADEGRVMVVKMRPVRAATDLEFAEALTADVQRIVDEIDPHGFHHEMSIELNGSYVQHQKRLKSVQDEVRGGSVAALLALLATLGLYFRSPRAVALVMIPLLASVVGALAFGWLAFGVLNIVSAFIFAVLLGLGIDFGIHVLARLRQERGRGLSSQNALAVCFATSGKTTAAGAVSTALAFAALSIADFQGFAQFGQVAAVGVVLSLLGSIFLMPALSVAFDRIRPWQPPAPREDSGGLGGWGRALSVIALLFAVGGTVVAGWAAMNIGGLEYQHDLKKLGPVRPKPTGPPRAGYRDAVGKAQTVDPAVVLVDTATQALEVQRQLDALVAMTPEEVEAFDAKAPPTRPMPEPPATLDSSIADLDDGEDWDEEGDEEEDDWDDGWGGKDKDLEDPVFVALETLAVDEAVMSGATAALLGTYDRARLLEMQRRLAKVWSVHAFVPRQQDQKLQVIADIRARIDGKRASLSDTTKAQIDEWYPYLSVEQPVQIDGLPGWVTGQFEDTQGDVARFVIVATKGSKANIVNSRGIYAAYGSMTTGDGEVDLAADFFVIPEIFDAIDADGPRVMAVSVAVMLLTALVLLRNVWGALGVAVTVGFSLMWLAAVFLGLDWKLNFFNIIVLPLLLGMGQDDALHLVERHREEVERTGKSNMGRVLREAGGAIFVTTLTTVLGFSGILFANHRGLESMAWAAVLGMTLALVASVVVLPILLHLGLEFGRRRGSSSPTSDSEAPDA